MIGMFAVWLLTVSLSLFHMGDSAMQKDCPISMSSEASCVSMENPLAMAEEHLRFAQQITQAVFQPDLLLLTLFLFTAVLLWSVIRTLALPLRWHPHPASFVSHVPLRQRQHEWLALHEQRDPYRF